eukprot:TRINITY_DN112409_c0_g1_i1.p1 TRINITY_DN112409_c0_g1~~TRINITY_DN112409_c0_g1_i1.p1  ORF type:complete len:131 (+),score=9.84 TRINITY_DN112409_c0_g1_i1:52-444(+)
MVINVASVAMAFTWALVSTCMIGSQSLVLEASSGLSSKHLANFTEEEGNTTQCPCNCPCPCTPPAEPPCVSKTLAPITGMQDACLQLVTDCQCGTAKICVGPVCFNCEWNFVIQECRASPKQCVNNATTR